MSVTSSEERKREQAVPAPTTGRGVAHSVLPSLEFCARLLDTATPSALCQSVTEEVSGRTTAAWVAAMHVSGEARAFEVAGAVGEVPSVLYDCHDMTPAELAGALGWNAQQPGAQRAQNRRSTVSRALTHEGGSVGFAVLAGAHTIRGILVAGWADAAVPSLTELADLTAVSEAGAAALRHTALVADLRMSERTKSEFVATMSHELRNPLSAILGYTDLLVHGDFGTLGEEQAEVLRRAHHSASSLLDLINATLDVSRFEVGADTALSSQIDLSVVLREEVDEISRGRHHGRVRVNVDESHKPTISGDPLKVRVTVRQTLQAVLSANRGEPLCAELRRHDAGCVIEIGPEALGGWSGGTPVIVELPEDAETQGVPFSVFVAKRLLELIGATLGVWRQPGGDWITFRMWIPASQPAEILGDAD